MQNKKVWKRIGVLVVALALCTGMVSVRAESIGEIDISAKQEVQPRWSVLRTLLIDCTISNKGIASIYSNAITKQTSQKVKVTATLTSFDLLTNSWTDYCSISDTGYGNAWVETNYMIPAEEGVYYNRTEVKCYNANGTLAESYTYYSEAQYYPGR